LVRGHYPGRPLPHGALPGLKTIGYWDAETAQDWGLAWHRNEGIEITFLESGELAFAVDGREYGLHADDLTVTRPWQLHRVGNSNVGASRLHWIIADVGVRRPNQSWKWPNWVMLSPPDLEELTNFLRQNERPVWKASPDLQRCFHAIAHAVESDRKGSSVSLLTVRVNELFVLLLEMLRRQKIRLDYSLSSSRRTVELLLADLRTHPEHLSLEWTVQEMARSCGLGVTRFVHHFRALTNMTPLHFVNQSRLALGAKLLRDNPAANITEIAFTCGFSSSQYFATAFSRLYGCSPREYRLETNTP
jgi:AraC family L-rhamnose operon regulatory protein RhaS